MTKNFARSVAALSLLFSLTVSSRSLAAAPAAVGATTPDGTKYAGISPDKDRPIFTTPADAPGVYRFNDGNAYCEALEAHGHQDWRMPTKGELNVLFQNRAAIGGFNETGSGPAGWYWSSSHYNGSNAWAQRFSGGHQGYYGRDYDSSLRCVR